MPEIEVTALQTTQARVRAVTASARPKARSGFDKMAKRWSEGRLCNNAHEG
jgi:hypothetical protein